MDTFTIRSAHGMAQLQAHMHARSLPFCVDLYGPDEQRSPQSHNHQFAEINDCFDNLPDSHKGAPYAASKDAFRKHGLIAKGYCDVTAISFASKEEAFEQAPQIAKLARANGQYALVVVRGELVVSSVPHSQSYKAMGKEKFQESKQAVLDWAHELLGVTV